MSGQRRVSVATVGDNCIDRYVGGDAMLATLAQLGVGVAPVRRLDAPTSVTEVALTEGYSFNSTSVEEIEPATEKLIEQKPLVLAYDSSNQRRNMINGVTLTQAWFNDELSVQQEIGDDKLKFVLPSERFLIWIDSLCIPVGPTGPYAAHLFMDYTLDPKVSAENTGSIWCMSPVPSCYDHMDPETGAFLKAHYPTEEVLERTEVGEDLGEFIVHYQDAWKEIVAA